MPDPVVTLPPDPSNVESALVAKLLADPVLMALLPDGVFVDESHPGAQRFVIVSLVDHQDVPQFGGVAYEDALYLVKAVVLSTAGGDIRAAAWRIQKLLEDKELVAPDYTFMTMHRESKIRSTEVDDVDPTIRWQHRGGRYRVQMAPA